MDGYPNMLYAFVLTNGLGRILYKLKAPDHCYIVWSNNSEHYLRILLHDQPDHILGMGLYSGVDQDAIRIETVTTNRFRNNPIDSSTESPNSLEINSFIKPTGYSKFASGLGNSWCNLISWKIMRLITSGKLKSQYTFLHIPKKLPTHRIVEILEQMLA